MAIIAAAAAITVATGGAAAGTLVGAINCAANGALVGAITQGAIGAATGAISGAVTHRLATGTWSGAAQAAANGAATGFLDGTISGAISGALNAPNCFVAGTLVLTVAGTVAIETIQAGDMVWAWDEETGDVALKEVVETYVNETYELIHVFVDGEEIVTTPAHPFYSPVKGWINAVHLRAGDILVLVNGEYVIVEKVQHEILDTPVAVYNFQVEQYHTYFITDVGVLVHNACPNKYGKKGGPDHQRVVQEAKEHFEQLGYNVSEEHLVRIPGGFKRSRYADLFVTDGVRSFGVQVGKQTIGGLPVARERRAIKDLLKVLDAVVFIAYN